VNAKALLLPSTSRWDFVFQFLRATEVEKLQDQQIWTFYSLFLPARFSTRFNSLSCGACHERNDHFTPKTRMIGLELEGMTQTP